MTKDQIIINYIKYVISLLQKVKGSYCLGKDPFITCQTIGNYIKISVSADFNKLIDNFFGDQGNGESVDHTRYKEPNYYHPWKIQDRIIEKIINDKTRSNK